MVDGGQHIGSPLGSRRRCASKDVWPSFFVNLAARTQTSDQVIPMKLGIDWEDPMYQFYQVCLPMEVTSQTFPMGLPVDSVAGIGSPFVTEADVFLKRLG